jgi:hypothetical protein
LTGGRFAALSIPRPPEAGFFVGNIMNERTGTQTRVTFDQFAPNTGVTKNGRRETNGSKLAGTGAEAANGARGPLSRDIINQHIPETHRLEGTLGQTGVVMLDDKGRVVGAIRGPQTIPARKIRHEDYIEVIFGGEQTPEHIERSFLREIGSEEAARVAREIIAAARESVHLPYHASKRGTEVESHRARISRTTQTGNIVKAPFEKQEELCRGTEEVALKPTNTIEEGMVLRAEHVISSAHDNLINYPGEFLLNTGVPLFGTVHDEGLKLNDGKYEDYVAAVSAKLRARIGRFDDYGAQVADHIATKMGYKNLEEMAATEPTMAYWFAAAGHHSVSLPHQEGGKNKFVVSTEIAVSAADVAASDMGKIAELLMYSSPIILGDTPLIDTPDGPKRPLDYRDLYRHLMSTSLPGDLIRDPQTLYERMTQGIKDQETYTLDRTAFRTSDPEGPSCHGPVRLRTVLQKDEQGEINPIARVEYTGAGSSFSLLDEAARDIFTDVLNLAAFEAVANEQTLEEYYKGKYPSLTRNDRRKAIGEDYNLNGSQGELAREVISESLRFMDDMADKYQPYEENIRFAQSRIANLLRAATARNFEDYAENPVGPVSQVMQHMYDDLRAEGKSEQEAALHVGVATAAYEYQTAQALMKTKGDPKPLLVGLN